MTQLVGERKMTYQELQQTVSVAYGMIDAGWYSALVGCVLPPERKIVAVATTRNMQDQLGYWFIPATSVQKSLTLANWLLEVRWKSLNGYGVDCVAWCKPLHKTITNNVTYEMLIKGDRL